MVSGPHIPMDSFLETDIMLAQTTDGFREVLQIKDDTNIFDTLGDASCLETVLTSQPPVLDAPVANPALHTEDAGYEIQPGQELHPVKEILSELMGVSVSYY